MCIGLLQIAQVTAFAGCRWCLCIIQSLHGGALLSTKSGSVNTQMFKQSNNVQTQMHETQQRATRKANTNKSNTGCVSLLGSCRGASSEAAEERRRAFVVVELQRSQLRSRFVFRGVLI